MAKSGDQKNLEKRNGGAVKTVWWQPAITMFFKLSVWIAAPVIIALYFGEWLDQRFKTKPWLFLICLGAAFAVSLFGLVRNTIKELRKFEKPSQGKDK